ncbi:MAG: zinc ribbon domain-containing protein [Nitrososphaerales archaeon]
MAFCSKCGKELAPDAAFCHSCGAKVGEAPPFVGGMHRGWERNHRWRREGRERNGRWGALSVFGFLLIIGLTISRYPDVFAKMDTYFDSWGMYGHPVLPAQGLGQIVIYFLTVCGIWGLIAAALRFAFTNSLSRPMRDMVGALFALYVADSFSQFYAHTITGSDLVLAFFVGLAMVIIADVAIVIFFPRHQRPVVPSTPVDEVI